MKALRTHDFIHGARAFLPGLGDLWDHREKPTSIHLFWGKGLWESHISAALALLVRRGKEVVYLPDCRAWLSSPIRYLRNTLVSAFVNSEPSFRDKSLDCETLESLANVCAQYRAGQLCFIVDRKKMSFANYELNVCRLGPEDFEIKSSFLWIHEGKRDRLKAKKLRGRSLVNRCLLNKFMWNSHALWREYDQRLGCNSVLCNLQIYDQVLYMYAFFLRLEITCKIKLLIEISLHCVENMKRREKAMHTSPRCVEKKEGGNPSPLS